MPLPRGTSASGDELRRTVLLSHLQTSQRHTNPKWTPTKPEMLSTAWSRLVGAYTLAKLTIKTDKLVAISGLARKADELHAQVGGKYLAGLWEAALPIELLWRVIDPASGSPTRPDSFTAPSWSWASVSGRRLGSPKRPDWLWTGVSPSMSTWKRMHQASLPRATWPDGRTPVRASVSVLSRQSVVCARDYGVSRPEIHIYRSPYHHGHPSHANLRPAWPVSARRVGFTFAISRARYS